MEGKKDEQRDTLRWFCSGYYLIIALDSKITVVCVEQLSELLSDGLKQNVTMWTECVRDLELLSV
jgi:hypothetical protein